MGGGGEGSGQVVTNYTMSAIDFNDDPGELGLREYAALMGVFKDQEGSGERINDFDTLILDPGLANTFY